MVTASVLERNLGRHVVFQHGGVSASQVAQEERVKGIEPSLSP